MKKHEELAFVFLIGLHRSTRGTYSGREWDDLDSSLQFTLIPSCHIQTRFVDKMYLQKILASGY